MVPPVNDRLGELDIVWNGVATCGDGSSEADGVIVGPCLRRVFRIVVGAYSERREDTPWRGVEIDESVNWYGVFPVWTRRAGGGYGWRVLHRNGLDPTYGRSRVDSLLHVREIIIVRILHREIIKDSRGPVIAPIAFGRGRWS